MAGERIALIGGHDDFGAMLQHVLRESGYEVDRFREDEVDFRATGRFAEYDFLVAADTLADRADEAAVVNFVVSAKGFLFYETDRAAGAAPALPAPYLRRSMGPEDIASMINDAVWLGTRTDGRPGRSTPRVKADLNVTYRYLGESRSSRIVSISANGMFIRTASPLPPGTPLQLSFRLPGEVGRIDAAGHVIYAIECDVTRGIITRPGAGARKIVALPGIGVVLDDIDDASRDAVRTFVERRLIPRAG